MSTSSSSREASPIPKGRRVELRRKSKREHSPKCMGLPANGGRHDGHGQFRPGPGKVFGIGRFYDGHGYGHPRQVLSCQCGNCNRWEAAQLFAAVVAIPIEVIELE
jgi:hypothetical protein